MDASTTAHASPPRPSTNQSTSNPGCGSAMPATPNGNHCDATAARAKAPTTPAKIAAATGVAVPVASARLRIPSARTGVRSAATSRTSRMS